MKLLVRSDGPIGGAPIMSAAVTGVIAPRNRRPKVHMLRPGDRILGARSSGYHANGYTLLIEKAMGLKDNFMTRLPSGITFGEVALEPTACYANLVGALMGHDVEVHGLQPITGDGVAKIAFDARPFTYRITDWPDVGEEFLFLKEVLGLSIKECLTTFNWRIGFVAFVPPHEVASAQRAAQRVGHELLDLGCVEEGKRGTIFGREHDLWLEAPGE
jgi:phosphoribosylaminoimidazole (AIR) synthetase